MHLNYLLKKTILLLMMLLASFFYNHEDNLADLRKHILEVKKQKPPIVKPLPKILFPTKQKVKNKTLKVWQRLLVFKQYPFDMLVLVGTVVAKERWALFSAPNGEIEKVKKGYVVGREQARIIKITSFGVKLKSDDLGEKLSRNFNADIL